MGSKLSSTSKSTDFGHDDDHDRIRIFEKQLKIIERDIQKSDQNPITEYKQFEKYFLANDGDVFKAISKLTSYDMFKYQIVNSRSVLFKPLDSDSNFIKSQLNPILKKGNLDELKKFMTGNEKRCKDIFSRLEHAGAPKIEFTKIVNDVDDTLKMNFSTGFDINLNYNK